MIALFIKKVASYMRCENDIRKGNVLLLEAKCNNWLGMWKVTGKCQYLADGLRRIENLYYELHPMLLEMRRCNRLPTLNKGKGSLAMDELCELHNLWLKMLPMTPYLSSVIQKSRHLSLIRRCALGLWGHCKRLRSNSGTNTEAELVRLITFFESSRVFKSNSRFSTMEDNTFWALANVKKDVLVGGTKDSEKNSVPVPV